MTHEHVTATDAVNDFVDWLYDHGPDPTIPRQELRCLYYIWKANKAIDDVARHCVSPVSGETMAQMRNRMMNLIQEERMVENLSNIVPFLRRKTTGDPEPS